MQLRRLTNYDTGKEKKIPQKIPLFTECCTLLTRRNTFDADFNDKLFRITEHSRFRIKHSTGDVNTYVSRPRLGVCTPGLSI
jgi:hypothetical protein